MPDAIGGALALAGTMFRDNTQERVMPTVRRLSRVRQALHGMAW